MTDQTRDQLEKLVSAENGHPRQFAASEFTREFKSVAIDFRTAVGLVRIKRTRQRTVVFSHDFKSDHNLIFSQLGLEIRRQNNMQLNPVPIRQSVCQGMIIA